MRKGEKREGTDKSTGDNIDGSSSSRRRRHRYDLNLYYDLSIYVVRRVKFYYYILIVTS